MEELSKSGIYAIQNTVNGKLYVGSAVRFRKRWRYHRNCLNAGTHDNRYLQQAWNKYGEAAFTFKILEVVEDKASLVATEQWWIDTLNVCNRARGYNLCPVAGSTLGYKATEETRARISAANKRRLAMGYRTILDAEARAQIGFANSRSYVVISPNGKGQQIRNLRKFCREHGLNYTAMNSVAKGRSQHHQGWRCELATQETLHKLESGFVWPSMEVKPSWRGKYIVTSPDGESFVIDQLESFCRENGFVQAGLWAVLSGRCNYYKGWHIKYATKEAVQALEAGTYTLPPRKPELYRGGYVVTDPEGNLYHVQNLHGFCKQRGLRSSTLGNVAKGKHKHHRGWRCSYPNKDLLDKITHGLKGEPFRPDPVGRRVLITEPNGKTYEIQNLHGFCKQQGLLFSSMQRVAVGIYSQYKGWRCKYLD